MLRKEMMSVLSEGCSEISTLDESDEAVDPVLNCVNYGPIMRLLIPLITMESDT